MATQAVELPVRVAVFSDVNTAEKVVRQLLGAGFHKEQISVICSDKYKEEHFRDLPPTPAPGDYTQEAIAAGSVVGATLGGLALVATAFVTGGASLLAAGTILVGGGALAGSFTGAMVTRGFTKEAANYYDQAVQKGKILIGVEDHGGDREESLARAERIFAEAGAEPVPLVEG